jgi:hypothetical protein
VLEPADREAAEPGKPADARPHLIEVLAAGTAHEVRNPLDALQINLGILEQSSRRSSPTAAATSSR